MKAAPGLSVAAGLLRAMSFGQAVANSLTGVMEALSCRPAERSTDRKLPSGKSSSGTPDRRCHGFVKARVKPNGRASSASGWIRNQI